jgi:hypothetical protein
MPELPPPLPPETRTVGQLVAETIRAYGANFWRALPLGLPLAVMAQVIYGYGFTTQVELLCLAAPLTSAAYVVATLLVLDARPPTRVIVRAYLVGVLVWLPAPILLRFFILPAVAWLSLFGLAVPAIVNEQIGFRGALARARRLATADFVHAMGSLCTLVIVFVLSAAVLGVLLQGQGSNTLRVAGFLAVLVLSPLLYLGGALLYFDQAARVGSRRTRLESKPKER